MSPSKVNEAETSSSILANYRLEIKLLLACLHTQPDPVQIQELLQADLDWPYLLETAHYHKVLPLLYTRLKSVNSETIPSGCLMELQEAFNANVARNLSRTRELGRLLALLGKEEIKVLAFKGPSLAQIAYRNLALRQFVDLDLLVPEEDVLKAHEVLAREGYTPEFKLTARQEQFFVGLHYEQAFKHETRGITIDLHWALLPKGFSFSSAKKAAFIWNAQWQQTVTFPHISKQPVPTLSNEIMLMFLCAHGTKDSWSGMGTICDIAYLLQNQPELDWNLVEKLIGQLGNRRMLLTGLYLAHHLLGAPLPENIRTWAKKETATIKLAVKAIKLLFEKRDSLVGWFVKDNLYLQSMESWRDKLWYWVDSLILPNPLDLEAVPLPSSFLYPLYYPIRLFRFSQKYTRLAFKNRSKAKI